MCLNSIFRGLARTTQHIGATSYQFQMIGADAKFVAAQVIDLQRLRNAAHEMCIHPPVREYLPPVNRQLAIAISARACPDPAVAELFTAFRKRAALVNVSPEAISGGECSHRVAVTKPSRIMFRTPATAMTKSRTVGDDTMQTHRKFPSFGATQPDTSCVAAALIIS